MDKKIIGVVLVSMMIIIPIQSVLGTSQYQILSDGKRSTSTAGYVDIISMIDQVNETLLSYYLEGLVEIGPRFTGSENCSEAAFYLYYEFRKLGLDVNIEPWRYVKYSCQNVVATHYGADTSSDAVYVICAHYDTISYPEPNDRSPGANDDGSGVAAMLAIAKICSQYSFNHTIRFVALSGEEVGTFGSHADVKKAYEKNENIIAVLNIDGVGYANSTNDGKILRVLAKDRSKWIVSFSEQIAYKYKDYIDLNVQHTLYYPSDQDPYYDYGYEGVHYVQKITVDQIPWIHTPEDTLDKINYTYLMKVTKLLLAITAELANKPIDVQIRIVTPYEGSLYLFDRFVLQLPNFNLYTIGLRGMTYLLGTTVVSVNISTGEEVDAVYFGIDSNRWHVCSEPPYEWRIQRTNYSLLFPLIGKHTLNVCVTTNSGKYAYDEMDIFVLLPLIYKS